ncbi:hypothetical protein [Spirillospora albida]|uniref:hypothetical protein n=1 Tax=Spirillospora albida TaxID=58123 RepID=UPI0004C291E4|nr:hypothetical protein [Spirillospora albida]
MTSRHLEQLANALIKGGWRTRTDLGRIPAVVRVWHPDVPLIGDNVSVHPGPDGQPWFHSSTGVPVAPCNDVRRAASEVAALLRPYVDIARAAEQPTRWPP